MKEVDLSKLPRKKGKFNKIDWKKSIGYKVPFVYDDIEGEFNIIEYDAKEQLAWLEYDGKIFDKGINTDNLQRCKIGYFLGKITNEFKYDIGYKWNNCEVIDREFRQEEQKPDKRGRVYKENRKWYKYKCNKCPYEGWIIEGSLKKGVGCACCANQIAVLGINTIWDTDRWMCDLGVSEEDAKRYTCGSKQKIEVTCPECNNKKKITIKTIKNRKTIGCTCGDGYSYPEKLISSMLMQLNIEFESQFSPKWISPKRYDIFVSKYNMIIEVHGGQHYKETNIGRSLLEEQENDKIKEQLAVVNGITNYIVLDCRYSELDYIRNSVLNSELSKLFDLSQVDWLKCEEFALKNIVREVCEYWSNKEDWESVSDLMKIFNIDRTLTIKYLKKGMKLGWCNYDEEKEYLKGVRKKNKNGRQVEMFKDGESLGIFESATELSRKSEGLFGVKLLKGNISAVCNGERNHHKGFAFRYK